MSRLLSWDELPVGGTVRPEEAERLRTGSWRTGLRPKVELTACIDCLLCWLYCPDSAIVVDGTAFAGFDLDVCKGCELCSVVCPTGAIQMVADDD